MTTAIRTTHGDTRHGALTPEYRAYNGMLARCSNPNRPDWADYGGRGITVCERWRFYPNFLADMGRKPSPRHSLDRIDNNGNYGPGNCRWATPVEQARNRRLRRPRRLKEACAKGHLYTPENTYTATNASGRTYRVCRVCRLASERRWYARHRGQA